jgi:hypothetical protein
MKASSRVLRVGNVTLDKDTICDDWSAKIELNFEFIVVDIDGCARSVFSRSDLLERLKGNSSKTSSER